MSKSLVSCFLTHSVDGGALANTTDTTCAGTVLSINDPSFPTKPAASFYIYRESRRKRRYFVIVKHCTLSNIINASCKADCRVT